jgi:hypothetical protein
MIEPKPTFEVYRPPKFRQVNVAQSVVQAIRELLSRQCEYIRKGGARAPIVKFWREIAELASDELREAIRTAEPERPASPPPMVFHKPVRANVRRV